MVFVCFLQQSLSAQSVLEKQVKLSYSDQPLFYVLNDIALRHRLEIKYTDKLTDGKRVDVSIRNKSLDYAIKKILDPHALTFKVIDERVIKVVPKEEKNEVQAYVGDPTRHNFNVAGLVIDKATGESLPYASIMVKGTLKGASSNIDGHFTLFKVPSDTHKIIVAYLGYQTTTVQLNPNTDLSNVTVRLEDFGATLQEVEILAEREDKLMEASQDISRVSITPAALATLPSFGEKDIFRSLQLLPGVSGSNESSAGLYVRGGTPDQNLILFDGFTVYHVDHLFGFFSAFNSNAIKDVQLYKGGFDAQFGGRLSSVVELTGKDGNSEQFNLGFGLSLMSANLFTEIPFADGKGSILLAGRRSFQSDFYSNIFESYTSSPDVPEGPLGARQQVQPNTYFYDVNAKITFKPDIKNKLSISFYNGEDNLDNSRNTDNSNLGGRFGGGTPNFTFNRETTDLTAWGNWGTGFTWSRLWNERLYSKTSLSYSNYYSERDRTNSLEVEREDTAFTNVTGTYEYNNLRDFSFKTDNEYKISTSNKAKFGIQSSYLDIDYNYLQNDTVTVLDRHHTGLLTAFYAHDEQTVANKIHLKAGLRANHYSITNDLYFEPRASLLIDLSKTVKLKGAWGKYYQFATRVVREDIQQGSRDFWLLADDAEVPISYAYHNIAGISFDLKEYLIDIEAYYKTLGGLSEYTTRFAQSGFGRDRTLEFEEYFYQGTGIAKGLEVLFQKKFGKVNGWLGYTLGEVKYQFPDFSDEPFYANQDVTHEFKTVLNYKVSDFTFGATFIYATGRPYTAPIGYYEIELLDGTLADYYEISEKNAFRYPDYHRFDLSVTYDFEIESSKGSIGLSLFNVYNRQNIWYKEFEVIEGELLETDVTLLGLTPSIFLKWNLH